MLGSRLARATALLGVSVSLAAAAAGCGGGEPATPEDAARAWVRAVDERDWARVCELSTPRRAECEQQVADSFGDWREPRVERVVTDSGSPRFSVSTAETRSAEQEVTQPGWTAYAPLEILLERHEGRYLVHLEIAVIR